MILFNSLPFLVKLYVILFLLFWLGILGLLILALRTTEKEFGKENVSYSVATVEFFAILYEMTSNLGLLTVFVILVFSLIGWIFFPLSLMPFSLLKRIGFS